MELVSSNIQYFNKLIPPIDPKWKTVSFFLFSFFRQGLFLTQLPQIYPFWSIWWTRRQITQLQTCFLDSACKFCFKVGDKNKRKKCKRQYERYVWKNLCWSKTRKQYRLIKWWVSSIQDKLAQLQLLDSLLFKNQKEFYILPMLEIAWLSCLKIIALNN